MKRFLFKKDKYILEIVMKINYVGFYDMKYSLYLFLM